MSGKARGWPQAFADALEADDWVEEVMPANGPGRPGWLLRGGDFAGIAKSRKLHYEWIAAILREVRESGDRPTMRIEARKEAAKNRTNNFGKEGNPWPPKRNRISSSSGETTSAPRT
jgi:hypothetical protein